jgi:hypothetical protein
MKGAAAGERYNAGMQMAGQGLSNALTYATGLDSDFGRKKTTTPPLANASLSSNIVGMPGYQQRNSSALTNYYKTRKSKSNF